MRRLVRIAERWYPMRLAAAWLALLLVVAGLGVIVLSERDYQLQKLRETRVQAEILAASATAALDFHDSEAARESVDAFRLNPEIRAAGVYDRAGHRLAGFRRSGGPLPEDPTRVQISSSDPIEMTLPVERAGERIGTVYIAAIREPFSRQLTRYGLIGLFIVMAVLLVTVLGVAQSSLRRANRELEERAKQLADANRDLQVEMEKREKTEEALRQAQKMEAVGQLTGGIAHDFNNLLTGIIGGLELMQKRIAQGRASEAGKYVNLALESAQRAATLTQRLLAFSRRQSLNPRPVDANALVHSTKDLLRRTIGESIALNLEIDPNLWTTRCDPHQLESALINLAINARDAMPRGGTLTIHTGNAVLGEHEAAEREVEAGDFVCIAVADTGTGMEPATVERAFEPFFTTKPAGKGTGLGLSMIYGFARQSGGYAEILSTAGEGTTVRLFLPRHGGGAEGRPDFEDEEAREAASADGERVLVVEDEDAVRCLVVEALGDAGFAVTQAEDGSTGLRIVQGPQPLDLLVTDVGLPGVNGRDLAQAARASRPDLPILFISGYAHHVAAGQDLFGPGAALLRKPFTVADIVTRAREMLAQVQRPEETSGGGS
jgi:signal transduction histidine kinase/CheY-like chemotaxis protein